MKLRHSYGNSHLPVRISVLQRADRWIGIPLCAVLTFVKLLLEPRIRAFPHQVQRILFIKFAEQGSTVLAYPAIQRAVKMVGRDNVYFVVFKNNRFVLDMMEVLPEENIITVAMSSLPALWFSVLRAIIRCRAIGIDAVIDLEFLMRLSAIFAFLSGAKSRVGIHTFFGEGPYRGNLMTHRLLYNPHLHTSQMFHVMVDALTRDPSTLPTLDFKPPATQIFAKFSPRSGETAEVIGLLKRENARFGGAPLVLLNPNASDLLPLRRWAPTRYVELARRLLGSYPELYIGFTGGRDEAASVNRLAQDVASNRVIPLAGKTTLRQLLVLCSQSEILVTNDSGPAHFASMTQCHVITLFGPETPALFSAKSPNATVLWAGIACSPCVNAYNSRQSRCRNNLCMQAITVDQVFEEVSRVLDARLHSAVNCPERSISHLADEHSLVRVPSVREAQQVAS
jgi:ADP-heptose:LPS heptosyltransferase